MRRVNPDGCPTSAEISSSEFASTRDNTNATVEPGRKEETSQEALNDEEMLRGRLLEGSITGESGDLNAHDGKTGGGASDDEYRGSRRDVVSITEGELPNEE